MLVEKESLWCQILEAKYSGEVKAMDSFWWKDLMSVFLGAGQGGWFRDSISRIIGDQSDVLFWEDDWWGVGPLKVIFPRLFIPSAQNRASISNMGSRGEVRWSWNFE